MVSLRVALLVRYCRTSHDATSPWEPQKPQEEVTSLHPVPKGKRKWISALAVPAAVSLSPSCSCLTAPMAAALIFGWWLVAASGAQQLPRPSLSLHPSQGIEVGDTVTLRCHLPWPAARVQLCQEGSFTPCMYEYNVQDMAVFSFAVTKWVHTGTYRCQYWMSEPAEPSEMSDPVQLVVTDHCFPTPGISMNPKGRVGMGTNITIRCRNMYHGATFLHKDGHSAPIQHQVPDDGGTATFTLFGVTPADTGTYRCSYHPDGYHFLSSPLGDSVTLEVTATPSPPGAGWSWEHPNTQSTQHPMGESRGNLVVAVLRVCAAALVFGLGVFFVLSARNLWIRRDESPGNKLNGLSL